MAKKLYDQVNDRQVTTTPIPGEETIQSFANVKPFRQSKRPSSEDNLRFDNINRIRRQTEDEATDYEIGTAVDTDLAEVRAERQDSWAKAFNAVVGGGVDGLGTYLEDVGYMFDFGDHFDRLSGGTIDGDNWLSNIGRDIKDWSADEFAIYEGELSNDAGFSEQFFRWGTLRSALDSMVGYGLAGITAGGVTKALGTALQTASPWLTIATKANPKTAKFLQNASPAVLTNVGEGKTMALEVYEEQMAQYAPLIESGAMTEDEAIRNASEAADEFQLVNLLFMGADYMGFKNLINAGVKLTKPGLKSLPKRLLVQGAQEYVEETGQKVGQGLVSASKFDSVEKEFGLWEGAGAFNYGINPENNQQLFNEHMGNYYQTKEGKAYEEIAREEAGGDEEALYELMTEHFTGVASDERLLNSSADGLFQRSVDIFTDPATQVEGAIGFFSGIGQWSITRLPNYKNELKEAKKQYKRQQDFLDKSKTIIGGRILDLENLNQVTKEINYEALYETDDNVDDVVDKDIENEVTPAEPGESTDINEVNIQSAWGEMVHNAFKLGTEKQLRNLVVEETKSQDEAISTKAKELLKDFDDVTGILKKSQIYYNPTKVSDLKLQVRGYNSITKTDAFGKLSKGKREEVLANLKQAEESLKEATSYSTQRKLLMKQRKFNKDSRRLEKYTKAQNTNGLYDIFNDETIDDSLRDTAALAIVGNSKGNEHAPKRKVKRDKEGKTEVLTDYEAKQKAEAQNRKEVAEEKSGKQLKAVDKRAGVLENELAGLTNIKDKSDKVLDLIIKKEQQIETLKNKRKAIVDVSNELKDLSGNEFSKQFKSALKERLEGKTKAETFNPKFTKEMGETVSNNSNSIGDDAREVIDNYNNANVSDVMGVADDVGVLVEKDGQASIGTLTRTTNPEGKVLYRVKTEKVSQTYSDDDFSEGKVAISHGMQTQPDGKIMYIFDMEGGGTVSISDTKMLDEISVRIHDAIIKDIKEDILLIDKPLSLFDTLKGINHPMAKAITKLFEKRLKEATIEISDNVPFTARTVGTKITVSESFYEESTRNQLVKTIIHEAIHILTSDILGNREGLNKEQLAIINKILAHRTRVVNALTKAEKLEYEEVVEWYTNAADNKVNSETSEANIKKLRLSGEFQKYYALINDKEFLAVVSTDQRTQEFIDEKLGKSGGISAIKELVQELLRLLGLENNTSGEIVDLMFDTAIIQSSIMYDSEQNTDTENQFDRKVSDTDKAILKEGSEIISNKPDAWTLEFVIALIANNSYLAINSEYWFNYKSVKNFHKVIESRLNSAYMNKQKAYTYTKEQYQAELAKYKGNLLDTYNLYASGDANMFTDPHTPGVIIALDLVMNAKASKKDTQSDDPTIPAKTQDDKDTLLRATSIVTIDLFTKRKSPSGKKTQLRELLKVIEENDFIVSTTSDVLNLIYDYLTEKQQLDLSNTYPTFARLLQEVSNETRSPLRLDSLDFNEAANIQEEGDNSIVSEIVAVNAIDVYSGETEYELIKVREGAEEQQKEKQDNIIVYIGRQVMNGFDKIAYLSRKYIKNSKPGRGGSEIVTYSDLNDSTIWSDVLSRTVKVNDKITLSVDSEYSGPVTYKNKEMTYAAFLKKTKGNKAVRDDYTPIRIMKGDQLLGYLHVSEWMSAKKMWGDVASNKTNVSAIRAYVMKNGTTTTKITSKSAGILFMLKGKQLASEVVGDDVNFYVGGNNNELLREPGKKEKTKTTKIPGVTYMKLELTNEHSVFVPVNNRELNAQQLLTINRVFQLLENKDKTDPLYKAVYNELGQDLTTTVGAKNFLKKYIRFAKIPSNLKGAEIDRFVSDLMNEAIEFNKPITAINSNGELVSSKTFSVNNPIKIQVDAAMLGTGSFNAFEVVVDEKGVEIIEDVNEARSYDMFIRDNVDSNFGGYANTKEDGTIEWVYSYQNVTGFATKFIDEKKGEEATADTEGTRGENRGDITDTEGFTEQQGEKRPNLEEQEGNEEFVDDNIDTVIGEELKEKCK